MRPGVAEENFILASTGATWGEGLRASFVDATQIRGQERPEPAETRQRFVSHLKVNPSETNNRSGTPPNIFTTGSL
jgi:hypothetical protein